MYSMVIAWVIFLALPVCVQAQEKAVVLTFDDALASAQAYSAALKSAEAAEKSAQEMAIVARQLPDPALKWAVNNVPLNGPEALSLTDDFMTMRSIGVMQTLVRRSKREAEARRFESEAALVQAAERMELLQVKEETAKAWFARYYAHQKDQLLKQQKIIAVEQIAAAQSRYRAKIVEQSDWITARAQTSELDNDIEQAKLDLLDANIQLNRWTGKKVESVSGQLPNISSLPSALIHQVNLHPALQLLEKEKSVALAQLDQARENKKTDWTIELMYSQRGAQFSNMGSIGLSMPLQWNQANRQDREIAAQLKMVESIEQKQLELLRMHTAQTQLFFKKWEFNLKKLARYDEVLIPLAQQREKAVLVAYKNNKTSLRDVLESQGMTLDVRLDRLQMALETAQLWAKLNYLIFVVGESRES